MCCQHYITLLGLLVILSMNVQGIKLQKPHYCGNIRMVICNMFDKHSKHNQMIAQLSVMGFPLAFSPWSTHSFYYPLFAVLFFVFVCFVFFGQTHSDFVFQHILEYQFWLLSVSFKDHGHFQVFNNVKNLSSTDLKHDFSWWDKCNPTVAHVQDLKQMDKTTRRAHLPITCTVKWLS